MKNRILLNEVSGIVTTDRGLEPLLTESESAVLPITPFRIILVYFVLSCPTQQGYYIRLSEKCNPFFEKITLEFLKKKA